MPGALHSVTHWLIAIAVAAAALDAADARTNVRLDGQTVVVHVPIEIKGPGPGSLTVRDTTTGRTTDGYAFIEQEVERIWNESMRGFRYECLKFRLDLELFPVADSYPGTPGHHLVRIDSGSDRSYWDSTGPDDRDPTSDFPFAYTRDMTGVFATPDPRILAHEIGHAVGLGDDYYHSRVYKPEAGGIGERAGGVVFLDRAGDEIPPGTFMTRGAGGPEPLHLIRMVSMMKRAGVFPTGDCSARGRGWVFPARLYRFVPAACPDCAATLQVYEFGQDGEAIALVGGRSVSKSRDGLTGYWYRYDPPPRLFPPVRDGASYARESEGVTRIHESTYSDSAGGRARDYVERHGVATFRHTLRMRNWALWVDEQYGPKDPARKSHQPIRNASIYDVEFRLDFHWLDYSLRQRTVDHEGYTRDRYVPGSSDWRVSMPAVPPGGASGGAAPPSTAPSHPVDAWLAAQARPYLEDAERLLRELAQRVQAEQSGPSTGGPAEFRRRAEASSPTTRHPAHAVHLAARWHRPEGRVTGQYLTDILQDVVHRRPTPSEIVLSDTVPAGAYDMEAPPSWPRANPRPAPAPRDRGGGFMRP